MIYIYVLDASPLYDDAVYQRYYEEALSYRKEKANKLKQKEDKARCIACDYLLRYGFRDYVSRKSGKSKSMKSELPLIVTLENGKPVFKAEGKEENNLVPFFSLSHTRDMVVCAMGDCELGIDTETIGRIQMNVAAKYFDKEIAGRLLEYLDTKKEEDEKQAEILFAKEWTRLEAVSKMDGRGIFHYLKSARDEKGKREEFFAHQICTLNQQEYMISLAMERDCQVELIQVSMDI